MSTVNTLVFYKDRDNSVLLKLRQNGIELAYTSVINKVTVKWRAGSVDSVANPTLFDVQNSGVRLKLGGINVAAPATLQALLIIHSNLYWPNGVVWTDRLTIKLLTG
jgi:hypothetical protein